MWTEEDRKLLVDRSVTVPKPAALSCDLQADDAGIQQCLLEIVSVC